MTDHPSHWAHVKLSQVATTQLGRMLSSKRETGMESRPYLRNRDVRWGRIDIADLPLMDFNLSDRERYSLQPGDLLVCEGGEVGRAAVWTGMLSECFFQKALHRVRPAIGVSPQYLRYLLEHYAMSRRFGQFTTGTTIPHLPQEDLRELPILLPPAAEQDRIVAAIEEAMSRIDGGRGALEQVARRSRALRRAIFRVGLPSEEPIVPLRSLVMDTIGGVWGQPPDSVDSSLIDVQVVRGTEFRQWETRRAASAAHRRISQAQLATRRLDFGDLVVEVSGGGPDQPVGRVLLIDDQALASAEHPLVCSNFCRKIVLADDIDPQFALLTLTALYETGGTVPFQTASTNIRNLNFNAFLDGAQLARPSKQSQTAVAAQITLMLEGVRATGRSLRECLARSAQLRAAVLNDAFTGHLVPQDSAEGTGAQLLAEIANAGKIGTPQMTRRRGFAHAQASA